MTDQTESESEEPLTPAECAEYLDDIAAKSAAGARNLAIPIELLSYSAAAIRALEASRDLIAHERNDLLLRLDADGIRDMEAERAYLRADRDRLAGEVFNLRADVMQWQTYFKTMVEFAAHNDARLTSELAAARKNEARWLWMFPADPLVSVTERMQRVYRKWDGSDSWNGAVDAARSAGGEG